MSAENTFIDSRDGKTYKTIKIGNQTLMAENLAYKTSSGCWAYQNNISNVATYGYLYDWETAIKVCPKGWHLPSIVEWQTLIDYLGGKDFAGGKMKEVGTTHWQSLNEGATNECVFSALPGGNRDYIDGLFFNLGSDGNWWSATEYAFGAADFGALTYATVTRMRICSTSSSRTGSRYVASRMIDNMAI